MSYLVQSNASEFECYLRDRAQRLGYLTRVLTLDGDTVLPESGSFALVEFRETLPETLALRDALDVNCAMRTLHDQNHFIAWAEHAGGLVQLNVVRKECGSGAGESNSTGKSSGTAAEPDGGRVGVRRYAEEFFGSMPARTLAFSEFLTYVNWLATVAAGPAAPMLAVAACLPDAKELLILWAPSLEAVLQSTRGPGPQQLKCDRPPGP